MLDKPQRRALLVEAHRSIQRIKAGFIEGLLADRASIDGYCMADRPLTDEDAQAVRQLTIAQVSALDKVVEGALGSVLFYFLALLDGAGPLDGLGADLDEWHGVELVRASAILPEFLHDDFYPAYLEMRGYEAEDHASDVPYGERPTPRLI